MTTKSTKHTALLVAAEFGYNYVVRKLLLSGANRHHKMNKGKQIHKRTNKQTHKQTLPNHFTGFTALHISAQHGQTETIQLLLQEGCNIDSLTESNWTPFMIAIWNEQHQAAEELKSHGANVHLKNQAGNTALALAAVKHTHLVKLCLSAGCDVNTQEFELNWTPLHVAAATGKQVVCLFVCLFTFCFISCCLFGLFTWFVYLLLGLSITHIHCLLHIPFYQDVVKTLLTHSANVNIPDRRGNTPLHLAAHQGYRNVVATLIEAGADVFALNAGNLTSLDIAKERMFIEIVRDLLTSIERSNYKHATGYPWS